VAATPVAGNPSSRRSRRPSFGASFTFPLRPGPCQKAGPPSPDRASWRDASVQPGPRFVFGDQPHADPSGPRWGNARLGECSPLGGRLDPARGRRSPRGSPSPRKSEEVLHVRDHRLAELHARRADCLHLIDAPGHRVGLRPLRQQIRWHLSRAVIPDRAFRGPDVHRRERRSGPIRHAQLRRRARQDDHRRAPARRGRRGTPRTARIAPTRRRARWR
jgi:hypothetical protein